MSPLYAPPPGVRGSLDASLDWKHAGLGLRSGATLTRFRGSDWEGVDSLAASRTLPSLMSEPFVAPYVLACIFRALLATLISRVTLLDARCVP